MALVPGEVESRLSIKRELARVTVTWGCLSTFVQGRLVYALMELVFILSNTARMGLHRSKTMRAFAGIAHR